MKAMKNRAPLARRRLNTIPVAVGACIASGLLTLGGCASFDTAATHATTPDNRIRLGWRDAPLFLHRTDLDNYACMDDLPLHCEAVSGRSLCHCPHR
jgi:hypothetical protein